MTNLFNTDVISESRSSNRAKILEAATLFNKGMNGGFAAQAQLKEAFSTSDFPVFLGSALEIEAIASFKERPAEWQGVAYKTKVNDFKEKRLGDLFGIDEFKDVPEGAEYPAGTLNEELRTISVGKTGLRYELTWETIVNGDFDRLANLPQRLAQAARNTEDRKVFSALLAADGNGVNTGFFTGDAAPTNLPLNYENLRAAIASVKLREGLNGEPVDASNLILVVPPALSGLANDLMAMTEIQTVEGKTTVKGGNALRNEIKRVVEVRALAKLNTAAAAATTWFLIPAPESANPALAIAHLTGRENPDIRVKNDQGQSVTGGSLDPREGSFDEDT
ncbi:MAG: hypothetical protein EOM43_07440, partial [Gammaproteobacteria bacterium]|nr:hypothetical protein [Gammaproteobacteria bacterium]